MAVLYFILFVCVLFSSGVSSKSYGSVVKPGGRIVGGEPVPITDAPYQAHVLLSQVVIFYLCGGSIISTKVVLTAAHCVLGQVLAEIRIGSSTANNGGTVYYSELLLPNPAYNPLTNDYDVGVIFTLLEMVLDGVTAKAVTLAASDATIDPGTLVEVTGWGTTSEGGNTSNNLMGVNVTTISNENCSESYSGITDRMLCAGVPEGGKDSCQGDSGGPLVRVDTGIQVGIVSFGNGCARSDYPGVYTRVSAVRSWITLVSGV